MKSSADLKETTSGFSGLELIPSPSLPKATRRPLRLFELKKTTISLPLSSSTSRWIETIRPSGRPLTILEFRRIWNRNIFRIRRLSVNEQKL